MRRPEMRLERRDLAVGICWNDVVSFFNWEVAWWTVTPSDDIRPLPVFDLSSAQLRPNFIREVVVWGRVPKGGLFPPAETVRGRGPEILDLELIVSIDVNLEIQIKSHIFKTGELLQESSHKRALLPSLISQKLCFWMMDHWELAAFQNCEPGISSSNLTSECVG